MVWTLTDSAGRQLGLPGPGYVFGSQQIFTTATVGATYTTPAGCRAILIEAIGPGGAGGGGATAAVSAGLGAGGASGGYGFLWLIGPAATYLYTVGTGGTAGTAGNNPGNNGSADTTFGSTLITAKLGNGGGGMAAGTTAGTL